MVAKGKQLQTRSTGLEVVLHLLRRGDTCQQEYISILQRVETAITDGVSLLREERL